MSASILFFIGASTLTLGAAYYMLRTMSMLKAGVALMGSALGSAFLLFTLHADVVATMTIMMFGPAMLGMILFMLMLMEDSGGFMMTGQMQMAERSGRGEPGEKGDLVVDDVESEVERQAAGILGNIGEIAPMTGGMDMARRIRKRAGPAGSPVPSSWQTPSSSCQRRGRSTPARRLSLNPSSSERRSSRSTCSSSKAAAF